MIADEVSTNINCPILHVYIIVCWYNSQQIQSLEQMSYAFFKSESQTVYTTPGLAETLSTLVKKSQVPCLNNFKYQVLTDTITYFNT